MHRSAVVLLLGVSAGMTLPARAAVSKPIAQPKQGQRDVKVFSCDTETYYRRTAGLPERIGDTCSSFLCDDPAVRDRYMPGAEDDILHLRILLNVFCEDDGRSCSATRSDIEEQMTTVNAAFLSHRLQFDWDSREINATVYRTLTQDDQVADMKRYHALDPGTQLNVYVTDLAWTNPPQGRGTFPWTPAALTAQGGIIMDDPFFGPDDETLVHEIGHCLGLIHTHRGVEEIIAGNIVPEPCDSPCREAPAATAAERDVSGDFCSDTAPTPINWFVCDGSGVDDPCSQEPWGPTDPQNYMGYTEPCWTEFSTQQSGRIHCWTEAELTSWVVEDVTPPSVTDVNVSPKDTSTDPPTVSDLVTVSATVTDETGVGSVVLIVDGWLVDAMVNTGGDAYAVEWDTGYPGGGNRVVEVMATDASGNSESATIAVRVIVNDCNGNGIDDACDISCDAPGCSPPCGDSPDADGNGVPDECETSVPLDGLIAYYPFLGNADDASPDGSYDGTVRGATPASDRFGQPDSAYSFVWENGVPDLIQLPGEVVDSRLDLTVFTVFNISSHPGGATILSCARNGSSNALLLFFGLLNRICG